MLCLLFFNSNIITWIALKLLYSWIYLYHSPTEIHYLWPHICRLFVAGELEVSPVTLYTKQRSAHKRCFIRKWHPNFSEDRQFPSEIQWYWNSRTGFRFWNVQSSTKCSPHRPAIQISVGGVYTLWCHKAQEVLGNISRWSGLWDL